MHKQFIGCCRDKLDDKPVLRDPEEFQRVVLEVFEQRQQYGMQQSCEQTLKDHGFTGVLVRLALTL